MIIFGLLEICTAIWANFWIPRARPKWYFEDINKSLVFLQTIEPFFSKEITNVISDAPEWKLKPQTSTKDKLGLHFAPSPSTSIGTPLGNSPTWSPLSVQEDGLQKQKFQAVSHSKCAKHFPFSLINVDIFYLDLFYLYCIYLHWTELGVNFYMIHMII